MAYKPKVLAVVDGGSGQSTIDAYAIVCGGTTDTGALQTVAGGATGTVLQGAGDALPTYSTATYPSTSGASNNVLTSNGTNFVSSAPQSVFNPNSTIQLFDDFIGTSSISNSSQAVNGLYGVLAWIPRTAVINSTFANINALTNANPGLLGNAAGDNSSQPLNYIFLGGGGTTLSTIVDSVILGGGTLTLNWVFKIATASTVTNRYTLTMGLGDTAAANQVNGCYVLYNDSVNSGNWEFITASASTRTTSTSSTSASVAWHNAQIVVNAAASSVAFSMDGVSLGTAITTNIPSTAITPFFGFTCTAGSIAANSILIDLFYMTQTLTTPR